MPAVPQGKELCTQLYAVTAVMLLLLLLCVRVCPNTAVPRAVCVVFAERLAIVSRHAHCFELLYTVLRFFVCFFHRDG